MGDWVRSGRRIMKGTRSSKVQTYSTQMGTSTSPLTHSAPNQGSHRGITDNSKEEKMVVREVDSRVKTKAALRSTPIRSNREGTTKGPGLGRTRGLMGGKKAQGPVSLRLMSSGTGVGFEFMVMMEVRIVSKVGIIKITSQVKAGLSKNFSGLEIKIKTRVSSSEATARTNITMMGIPMGINSKEIVFDRIYMYKT